MKNQNLILAFITLSFSLPSVAAVNLDSLVKTTENPQNMVRYEPLADEQTEWKDLKDDINDAIPIKQLVDEIEKREAKLVEAQNALELGVRIDKDGKSFFRYQNWGKLGGLITAGFGGLMLAERVLSGSIRSWSYETIVDQTTGAEEFKKVYGKIDSKMYLGTGFLIAGTAIILFSKYLDRANSNNIVEISDYERERLELAIEQTQKQLATLRGLVATLHGMNSVR